MDRSNFQEREKFLKLYLQFEHVVKLQKQLRREFGQTKPELSPHTIVSTAHTSLSVDSSSRLVRQDFF